MKVKKILQILHDQKIETWFDLGLFLDRFKEEKEVPGGEFLGFYEDFKTNLREGGIAFVSFYFGVDGVTIETEKYVKCFIELLGSVPTHYIAGNFHPEGDIFINKGSKKFTIPEAQSFDKWPLYKDFFLTDLERGNKTYNRLITDFWRETLIIIEKLGTYIEEQGINLLYLINVCSNPGNISLALAVVIVSEYMGIPVINNNHDFYWEGGSRKEDIESGAKYPGPRDFFFRNAGLGEVFSIIEMIYPWESRSWMNVNINRSQTKHLININGHNPANVCEIGTAVDIKRFRQITKRSKLKAFLQIKAMLSRYEKNLQVYTPHEVIQSKMVDEEQLEPILIGAEPTKDLDFVNNNILFLQPTRVMFRKKIEVGFKLADKLFSSTNFIRKFSSNSQLTLTILVTGPIPMGQFQYFLKLLISFNELLEKLPLAFKNRIFLGFLFSEFDKNSAKDAFDEPVCIPEIYNIASLILLPSETEGRGLPIIEATACGIPIFCRRYYPHEVYDEVIGRHLEKKDRLKVLEFERGVITEKMISQITDWVFFPQNFIGDMKHNHRAVSKRYSLTALKESIRHIFRRLYKQLKPNYFSMKRVVMILMEYKETLDKGYKKLGKILNTENRHYLPGFGRLRFMNFLKSLIDPSFFRVEEQFIRGQAMKFARKLVEQYASPEFTSQSKVFSFYNAIDNIFRYREGDLSIRHDHALTYRHRNKYYYPYQDFTYQELTGLINVFYSKIIATYGKSRVELNPHFFTNWDLVLFQLTNSSDLAIDNRERLIQYLHSRRPIILFPGEYILYELELFVLQAVRSRLKLHIEEELTEEHLMGLNTSKPMAYIFCPEKPVGTDLTAKGLDEFVNESDDLELKLLFKYDICQIIPTKQPCIGIHFALLGDKAIKILEELHEAKGFIISNDEHAAIMTDIVDFDRFHIGKVLDPLSSRIMGIPQNSGYVQFVPAGVRASLAYPTPIQTAKDFNSILQSERFKTLAEKMGEYKLFAHIRKDAENCGSPLEEILDTLELGEDKKHAPITHSYLNGIYSDGYPWSGVIARIHTARSSWRFAAIQGEKKKVTSFIEQYRTETGKNPRIGWNGGYMLNAELVGKLGLPETYIGSPLGLIIDRGEIICPPLFNKPAFVVDKKGKIDILRVKADQGLLLEAFGETLQMDRTSYNCENPGEDQPVYYDLLYPGETISGKNRVIFRLAGRKVIEMIRGEQEVEILPTGLTISIPEKNCPPSWEKGDINFRIKVEGLPEWEYAIEAGPLLVEKGKIAINMPEEGWTLSNSIRTQAARIDFTDMRGPKIALGMDEKGNLMLLAINGRIRESVGATHKDMAEILMHEGAVKVMGFDPGGSATLVIDGKNMNISPYNSDYEKDIFSLPPEPRPVGNAVVGWLET